MNTMDQIKIIYGEDEKRVPIQEFLKAENLSGITKKTQDSLKDLYRLNGENNPPLFHFPDFPEDKPLIIDCKTPVDTDEYGAHYIPGMHVVEFVKNWHDNPHRDNCSFTELLAHELTHAEQDVDEINQVWRGDTPRRINGLRFHQIRLLMEGQAYAKGKKIRRMLEGEKWYASDNERIRDVELEFEWLKSSPLYRGLWEDFSPIKPEDKPLTSIPTAFNLSNNLLSSISHFPRETTRLDLRDNFDDRDFYTYFYNDISEKRRTRVAFNLLVKFMFDQNITQETLQENLEKIDFLLNLKDNQGKKNLLPDNAIKDSFDYHPTGMGQLCTHLENAVDLEGKKIFPNRFPKKVWDMTTSEFSECIHRYLDAVTPDISLDSDLTIDSQPKILDNNKPPKKSMINRLQSCAYKKDPNIEKGKTVATAKLIRDAHQAGG